MKKPEGPIGYTQSPAQGDHEGDEHAIHIDTETKAHGDEPAKASGPHDNQGGR